MLVFAGNRWLHHYWKKMFQSFYSKLPLHYLLRLELIIVMVIVIVPLRELAP